jgi:radical SAM superfamily enzyme with C-terminal helix-hairpin-helix motif
MMGGVSVILDCYTVEPSGLGVPPYLSTYVRDGFSALCKARAGGTVSYLTIDDVRWCLNGGRPLEDPPLSDPLTYSATVNRPDAIRLLRDAEVVVVVAGDKVPSVHLHAQNGSVDEIGRALSCVRGRRVLLGPMATYLPAEPGLFTGLFDAAHTHTVLSRNLLLGSSEPARYEDLAKDRGSYEPLVAQMKWRPVAEIELYRGCTRRRFCSFCNEPVKHPEVAFRPRSDVLDEIGRLYRAGVRNFRLGQQTCFFSYMNRDADEISALLAEIRDGCPDLEVLHIDNADPLAVASKSGARIALLVAEHCTEGNCAPMGIESFDPVVIDRNALTCKPEVLLRAVEHINEAGAQLGPAGQPLLLPGLNIIYGLPGETHRTHFENLRWLVRILDEGLLCHRTNVRQARTYDGTPLAAQTDPGDLPPSGDHFATWKEDISQVYDMPMKQRVYPTGRTLRGLHSFFVSSQGTWHRRLGSYPIQIVERDTTRPLYEPADMTVRDHAGRYVYGTRAAA